MTQRDTNDSQKRVPHSEQTSEAQDAIIGEVPVRDDDELEDDDKEFDDANEPAGDPAKNVPSA
jgi:hypothetical protein